MKRRHLAVWFAAWLLVGLVALLPLRLVLRDGVPDALFATDAGGSLWRGELTGVAWQGVPLDPIGTHLAPALWLKGEWGWSLDQSGTSGTWVAAPSTGIRALSGRWALPPIGGRAAWLSLEGVDLMFDGDRCLQATGRLQVELDTEAGPATLQGQARCDGSMVRATLAPAGPSALAATALALDAELHPDGRVVLAPAGA